MYAIIKTGSKQYKVGQGDIIEVEKLDTGDKKSFTFDEVLLISDGDKNIEIGEPAVKGAKVVCDVLPETRGEKKTAFKYKRRKGYHRKVGHRQDLSVLKVKEIKLK